MGLTITRAYVELLGGAMALESTPGVGSRFSFSLTLPPNEEEIDEAAQDWERVQRLAEGERVHALIVDDVQTNLDILEEMLHGIGVETQTAGSGGEALANVRQHLPDVVFLDIRMPGMGGEEVVERLLEEHGERAPRIVAVTASVLDHERKRYLDHGFDDFIAKPVRATQLYACLAKHLGVKYVYTEAASEEVADWRGARLSAAMYDELEQAVNTHSITRLTDLLDPIAADVPALGAQLRELVGRYDIPGVKALLGEIEKR